MGFVQWREFAKHGNLPPTLLGVFYTLNWLFGSGHLLGATDVRILRKYRSLHKVPCFPGMKSFLGSDQNPVRREFNQTNASCLETEMLFA